MNVQFDMRELSKAIEEKAARSKRDMAGIVNQAAFNTCARAMRATPQADRQQIRQYLGEWVGAPAVNGRVQSQPSNRFGTRHKRAARQLRRVTLIAQALFYKTHGYGIGKGKSNKRTKRAKVGPTARAGAVKLGSDYGDAMMRYAGKLFNRAVRSTGYLAAAFVPALRLLAPLVRFKGLATGLPYRVLWQRGSAFGSADAATPGATPEATVTLAIQGRRVNSEAQAKIKQAFDQASADEAAEMRRHEREVLEGLYA